MPSKLAVVPLVLAAPVFAQSARWEYVEIPRGDADVANVTGVNELGQAVGVREWGSPFDPGYRTQAFLWDGSQRIDFENPEDGRIEPRGISNDGRIYANCVRPDGMGQAGRLSEQGFQPFEYAYGTPKSSGVRFVHPDGSFVVGVQRESGSYAEFGSGDLVTERAGQPTSDPYYLLRFNSRRESIGFNYGEFSVDSYFEREQGFNLLAKPAAFNDVFAYALNENGDVVGTAIGGDASAFGLPLRWDENGFDVLPMPEGAVYGEARDINDAGQIAGLIWTQGPDGFADGVIWEGDGYTRISPNLVGLPDGYDFSGAFEITNSGFVLVYGGAPFGENGSRSTNFLLRPIPSPGAWVLVALGLGLSASRRRARAERVTP